MGGQVGMRGEVRRAKEDTRQPTKMRMGGGLRVARHPPVSPTWVILFSGLGEMERSIWDQSRLEEEEASTASLASCEAGGK
jgi:hypothetical protein